MCGQWRLKSSEGSSFDKVYLPLGKLKGITDEAADYLPEVYVWGGEPTLHPDFAEFISYVKKRGLLCTVNTNGTLLKNLAGKIIDSGVDSLDISLDGPTEIHDSIRGVPGTYARIMEGLAELEKKRFGRKPIIKAVITLGKENLEYVEKLLTDLESNSVVQMIIIQLGWFTTKESGRKYTQQLQEGFGLSASSWKGFEDNQAHERARQTRELIQRIKKGSYRKPILFFPSLRMDFVEKYYTHHEDPLGRRECWAIHHGVHIRPNGDVVVCGDYPDIVVGNVYEKTIKAIWKGEKLMDFRRYVNEKGLFSICTRCCGFFS
jgi:radical SAM protein with 4Fe4S-binding SPASM domain